MELTLGDWDAEVVLLPPPLRPEAVGPTPDTVGDTLGDLLLDTLPVRVGDTLLDRETELDPVPTPSPWMVPVTLRVERGLVGELQGQVEGVLDGEDVKEDVEERHRVTLPVEDTEGEERELPERDGDTVPEAVLFRLTVGAGEVEIAGEVVREGEPLPLLLPAKEGDCVPLGIGDWEGLSGTVTVGVGRAQGDGVWVRLPTPGVTVTVGTEGGDRLPLAEVVPLGHWERVTEGDLD